MKVQRRGGNFPSIDEDVLQNQADPISIPGGGDIGESILLGPGEPTFPEPGDGPHVDRSNPPPGNRGGGGPLGGIRENRQPPRLRSVNTPTIGQAPNVGFAQGASLPGMETSLPSADEGSSFAQGGVPPLPSLSSPSPESMVFPSAGGGQKLFGRRGGQFGGGLSLTGQDSTTGGTEDPSALIESLLKLINQG